MVNNTKGSIFESDLDNWIFKSVCVFNNMGDDKKYKPNWIQIQELQKGENKYLMIDSLNDRTY